MFREWNYLVAEMWLLLLLAAILGTIAGWLFWGRRAVSGGMGAMEDVQNTLQERTQRMNSLQARLTDANGRFDRDMSERNAQIASLEKELDTYRSRGAVDSAQMSQQISDGEERIAELEARMSQPMQEMQAELDEYRSELRAKEAQISDRERMLKNVMEGKDPDEKSDYDGPIITTITGTQPIVFTKPRGGSADDLKQINGVGPKLERVLNELGVFHIDQIANWTDDEVMWVDDNLGDFNGRVSRDHWVQKAREIVEKAKT